MNRDQPSATPGRWVNTASMPRRNDSPRRVRNGLKLQSKNPLEPRNPVAAKWLKWLESNLPHAELASGLEYARMGQAVSLDVTVGAVNAAVQGMAYRPHQVRLTFNTLTPPTWSRLIELMSGEAIHVANLLAGELPPAIDRLFAEAGAPIFEAADAVEFRCDCNLGGQCRHAAAVGYLFVEHLESHPLNVFTVMGMSAETLLDRLRHLRRQQGDAPQAGTLNSQLSENLATVLPLEACIEEFWHAPQYGSSATGQEQQAPLAHAPHALLRRLGPSSLQGKFPMVGLLASIYDSVSQVARKVRDDSNSEGGQSAENGAL